MQIGTPEGSAIAPGSQAFINLKDSIHERIETAIQTIQNLIGQGYAIVMTLSSGKDSSTTTMLALEAIRRMKGIKQAPHFISSSSTSVENPEIENALLQMHEDIAAWVSKHELPVQVRMVEPHAASRFVVNVVGRGTLPRFVENGSKRTCSQDWKVKPQQRLAQEIIDSVLADGFKETVTVLGTRFDESSHRQAAMRRRGDDDMRPVRNPDGFLTLSLIAQWSESDVWDFLSMFLVDETTPFDSYVEAGAVRRMLDLYRDGNEGTCGMFMSDGRRAPCGSRFGCWTCTITGDRDKSMESMLNADPRYEYMRGLSDFRNFLIATQWDMGRRELVGRTLSDVGHIAVRPDVYNLRMRQDMLGYLITLDVLEEERAQRMEDDVAMGLVPATSENLRMCEPQFRIVRESDLVLVDFFWSMHHYASSAFPALQIWYEIRTLGRRYTIPRLAKIERDGREIERRWVAVGAWNQDAPVDGLRDYKAELWNPYLHPDRPVKNMQLGNERLVYHETGDTLQVEACDAVLFLDTYCSGDMPFQTQHHAAIESARFWLNESIIKLPQGMAGRYQEMAKRGQYFANLAERLNLTPQEMDRYLKEHSISEGEHNALLQSLGSVPDPQFDLF
ncbi:phosphoadenosine phosphosulfate reductase family protein [Curvibacter sp. APW13]|uniref:phosphoadenosine phosphosulfate reductase domain-containing protein n=1 Tax=Curvibacter sp. APW13 TaxID=3077236 RepID=UPI0028DF9BEE|nr:phosphoadenosine phosphosulfate reductase family protein [Curvibacter sp. APW13]MDT8992712.1 phosphoadenosine phosphosulfate reductase family protein [Curvibacter sp. APW13]